MFAFNRNISEFGKFVANACIYSINIVLYFSRGISEWVQEYLYDDYELVILFIKLISA